MVPSERQKMIQGAIFDMDGLMFDSERIWLDSWDTAFARRGVPLKPEVKKNVPGMDRPHVMEYIARLYDGDPDAVAAAREHFEVAGEELLAHGAPKKKGLDELLLYLGKHDVPRAVASSTARPIVEANLQHADVRRFFADDAIVTGDLGLASKPAPDIFLEAARRLGVEPAHTIVMEDSGNGIRAAYAGGFIPVLVPDVAPPTAEVAKLAAVRCDSLLDVLAMLERGEL